MQNKKAPLWNRSVTGRGSWSCNIRGKEIRAQDIVQFHLHLWCLWTLGKKLNFFFVVQVSEKRTWYNRKGIDIGARNIQIQNTALLFYGLLLLDKLLTSINLSFLVCKIWIKKPYLTMRYCSWKCLVQSKAQYKYYIQPLLLFCKKILMSWNEGLK